MSLSSSDPGAGLGESRRLLLERLKRRGPSTLAELGAGLDLSPATVREHVLGLVADGWVRRLGVRRGVPGRPRIVFGLTDKGHQYFVRGGPELLADLCRHLVEGGQEELLSEFFERRVVSRWSSLAGQLDGVTGEARARAVAERLSADGFMAEVEAAGPDGELVLRLCNCPLRDVVRVTRVPCRVELGFLRALLGGSASRIAYAPDGDGGCSYVISAADAANPPGAGTFGRLRADGVGPTGAGRS